jgi:hypothetical protein
MALMTIQTMGKSPKQIPRSVELRARFMSAIPQHLKFVFGAATNFAMAEF